MRTFSLAVCVLLSIAMLVACSSSTAVSPQQSTSTFVPAAAPAVLSSEPVPTTAPTVLTSQDEIAIYAAVIRKLAGPDDTFGGQLKKAILYIPRTPNNAAAKPGSIGTVSPLLSTPIQQGITHALADLPSQVIWVDSIKDIPVDSNTSRVQNDGVVVEIGSITFDGKQASVPGSIYIANLAAGGTTYILEQQQGQWIVSGTNGESWIS